MGLRRLTSFPIHPFLVALLPIIYFYEANFRTLGDYDGVRLGVIYLLVTAALLVVGRLVWEDIHRAALVLTPLAVVLFLGAKVGGPVAVGLLVLALGLGILFRLRRWDLWQASVILNAMALVLAVTPVFQTVQAARAKEAPVATDLFRRAIELNSRPGLTPPDIYSQMFMAGPLIILYNLSIILSLFVTLNRERKQAAIDRGE